jgi:DNA repair exonuclease SbcCD nuclease subunit
MKSTVLFFTDPHNSDTPPRMRREGYRDQILAKQAYIIPFAKQADITIIGGDIFHQKNPHKVSFFLVNKIMEIYREYGTVYIVPGNHDYNMSPLELRYMSPLGVISNLPNVSVLHGVVAKGIHGMDLFFKGLGDFKEEQTLVQMLKEWQVDQTERHKVMSSILYNVAVIHDVVSYRPFLTKPLPYETIPFENIEMYADLFLLGHIHKPQGETAKMVSPGALSRGSLERDTVDRAVVFVTIDIDTDERRHDVHPHRLSVKPAEEVFKIDQKVAEIQIDDKVNKFLEYLQTVHVDLKVSDVQEMIQKIELMDIDERVKQEAVKILEQL